MLLSLSIILVLSVYSGHCGSIASLLDYFDPVRPGKLFLLQGIFFALILNALPGASFHYYGLTVLSPPVFQKEPKESRK